MNYRHNFNYQIRKVNMSYFFSIVILQCNYLKMADNYCSKKQHPITEKITQILTSTSHQITLCRIFLHKNIQGNKTVNHKAKFVLQLPLQNTF